jgi:hypothetical protein
MEVGATMGADGVDVGTPLVIGARAVEDPAVGELMSNVGDAVMMGKVNYSGTRDGSSVVCCWKMSTSWRSW